MRERKITFRDEDEITLADQAGQPVLRIAFYSGSQQGIQISLLGRGTECGNPILLSVDPEVLNHKRRARKRR